MEALELLSTGVSFIVEIMSLIIVIYFPFSAFILTGILTHNLKLVMFVGILSFLIAIPWYMSAILVALSSGIQTEYLFSVVIQFMN